MCDHRAHIACVWPISVIFLSVKYIIIYPYFAVENRSNIQNVCTYYMYTIHASSNVISPSECFIVHSISRISQFGIDWGGKAFWWFHHDFGQWFSIRRKVSLFIQRCLTNLMFIGSNRISRRNFIKIHPLAAWIRKPWNMGSENSRPKSKSW